MSIGTFKNRELEKLQKFYSTKLLKEKYCRMNARNVFGYTCRTRYGWTVIFDLF